MKSNPIQQNRQNPAFGSLYCLKLGKKADPSLFAERADELAEMIKKTNFLDRHSPVQQTCRFRVDYFPDVFGASASDAKVFIPEYNPEDSFLAPFKRIVGIWEDSLIGIVTGNSIREMRSIFGVVSGKIRSQTLPERLNSISKKELTGFLLNMGSADKNTGMLPINPEISLRHQISVYLNNNGLAVSPKRKVMIVPDENLERIRNNAVETANPEIITNRSHLKLVR